MFILTIKTFGLFTKRN